MLERIWLLSVVIGITPRTVVPGILFSLTAPCLWRVTLLLDTGSNTSNQWTNQYDDNDDGDSLGAGYGRTYVARLGGSWNYSSHCGSRSSAFYYGPLYLYDDIAARGVCRCRPSVF